MANIGGQLGIAGDDLRILWPVDYPPEKKDAIRAHKAGLLELLRLNFLIVHSDALNASLLWTPDEATKESLIAAGAEPSSIYTAAELDQLVQRRVTSAELLPIHEAKERLIGKPREP